MTQNPFRPATRSQSKLRFALMGASGSGKSFTALKIASGLGGKIAAIDTERGSLSKYAGLGVEFDVLELTDYHPQKYIEAIRAAVANGYDVLLIDSLSHAWSGSGGILEQVDKAAKRSQSNNSFAAWRDVTPIHNQLIETILGANVHIIVTMRSKTEYVLEKDERTGRTQPRKVGLAPVQRDGMEYEFDVVAEMDMDNTLLVSKSRCIPLNGASVNKPDAALGHTLKSWLSDGTPTEPVKTTTPLPASVRAKTDVITHNPDDEQSPSAIRRREEAAKFDDVALATQTEPEQPADTPQPKNLGELKTLVVKTHKWVGGGQTHWDRLMSLLQGESKEFETAMLENDYAKMYTFIKAHYEAKELDKAS